MNGIHHKERRSAPWPSWLHAPVAVTVILGLLGIGTFVVYRTGGTSYAYPYLMLIPVMFAAALFRMPGGILTAGAAALLIGPFMPLDVARDIPQETTNWLLRLGMYLVLGGFTGILFTLLHRSTMSREQVMRTDRRTGLPNEVALEEDLTRALAQSNPPQRSVGLILVRVTDLIDIVVALGVRVAEELTQALADHLATALPQGAEIYSVSVSELRLLLPDSDIGRLDRTVQRLIEIGEETQLVHGIPLRVQLVIGSSLQVEKSVDPQELIRQTRVAEYTATRSNLIYCQYLPQLDKRESEMLALVARVRDALEADEFELHYQPKIRLADESVQGCEGLIRWRGRDGDLIPPYTFMPKVERTTLILPLTRFVAEQACAFVANRAIDSVSINLSVSALMDESLLEFIPRLMADAGVPPDSIEIEITESSLIHAPDTAKRIVEQYRSLGFRVTLDDYGTGFASLDYLRYLPLTGLKIDRIFIQDIEIDEHARALVRSVMDVSRILGLEVTAEGVETSGQHKILQTMECDYAQGFYYALPMPEQKFEQWAKGYGAKEQN